VSADYKVGYRRPPQHSRFQKGKSGNPRGRPKGARNFVTEVQEALGEMMLVRQGGTARRLTRRSAVVLSLLDKALKGDVRAASLLIGIEGRAEASNAGLPDAAPSADEAEVLEGFVARIRARPPSKPTDEEPGA
jgi:hypothetical protein